MKKVIVILAFLWVAVAAVAQELQVKISINSQQVEGTDKSVFENLQQTLEQWMNDRQWTELQFQKNERITVSFNVTVNKWEKNANRFACTALIQANRPVFNSAYTTTLYNNKDADFNFEFAQFDQLNFLLCLSDYRARPGLLLTPGRYGRIATLHAADQQCTGSGVHGMESF